MTDRLNLLADDLVTLARDYLPNNGAASILGVELSASPVIALLVERGGEAPRAIARYPARADDSELVQAAGTLAAHWASALTPDLVAACAVALKRGAHLRVYAHRNGEIALAVADGQQTLELAHRAIAMDAAID